MVYIPKKKKEYALYKGEEFIDLGTAQYLAQKMGISERTIYSMATQHHKSRDKGNAIIAIKIEDDEEE